MRVSVLTQHNDNARTGANLAETVLTPEVVRTRFGFLFSLPVDGHIYAQPLFVPDLDLGSAGVHDASSSPPSTTRLRLRRQRAGGAVVAALVRHAVT